MKINLILKIACLIFGMSFPAHADSWLLPKPTEFFSENRKYALKIVPHSGPYKPGHCLATLFRGNKEIWSRHLINNQGPVRVFVANSGQYVVTMDEWGHVGELPVVIYGFRGDLIRVHSTDSLGLEDDILRIERTISSYWWNADSVNFFGPDETEFLIRLNWGKSIVLDLSNGNLLQKDETFYRDDLRKEYEQKWEKLERYRKRTLAAHAIRMLHSKEDDERRTGALICGQEKLTKAIPELRKLLADKASFSTYGPKEHTTVYFVRKAAKEALEAMGEKVGDVVTEEPEVR